MARGTRSIGQQGNDMLTFFFYDEKTEAFTVP
jgi:hypothetical protein